MLNMHRLFLPCPCLVKPVLLLTIAQSLIGSPKLDNRRLEKPCLVWRVSCSAGTDGRVRIYCNGSIRPCNNGSGWWWYNSVGDIFLLIFSISWALFKSCSLPKYCHWPQYTNLLTKSMRIGKRCVIPGDTNCLLGGRESGLLLNHFYQLC